MGLLKVLASLPCHKKVSKKQKLLSFFGNRYYNQRPRFFFFSGFLEMSKIAMRLQQNSLLPWLIWGVCALFYFYIYLLQASPNVMVFPLMKEFKIDAAGLGSFAAYFFWPYMALQIIVGFLFDRFGSKLLMVTAILLTAVGCLLFSVAHLFFIAELGRFLMGIGSAFSMIGALSLTASWFPPQRYSLLFGLLMAIGMLGAGLGSALLSPTISLLGWRGSMALLGVLGLLLAMAAGLVIRVPAHNSTEGIDDLVLQKPSLRVALKRVILKKQNWLCSAFAGLIFSPTIIIGMLWGVPFFVLAYHFSQRIAALLISIIFLGWMAGGPFFGWFFERINRSRAGLVFGGIGLLVSSICIIYIPNWSVFNLSLLLFAFGFFCSSELLGFILVRANNSSRYVSTSLGFANVLGSAGGAVIPPIIGLLLDLSSKGKIDKGMHFYSLHDYHLAFVVIPVLVAIALLLIPFMDSINPKHVSQSSGEQE